MTPAKTLRWADSVLHPIVFHKIVYLYIFVSVCRCRCVGVYEFVGLVHIKQCNSITV